MPALGLSLGRNGTGRAFVTSQSLEGAAHPLLSGCERRGIPEEQGPKRRGGGHPRVLVEQDPDVLQCGTVPLRPLLLLSRRSLMSPWLPDAQVCLVWSNKGALGSQELSTLLGCCSVPALL